MYGCSPLRCTSFVFWCLVIFASWFERPNHKQVQKKMEEGGEDDNNNDNNNNDDDDEEEAEEEERTSFAFWGLFLSGSHCLVWIPRQSSYSS
ncbi:uncharacterized protein BO87DRAFT_378813 [Aspergillus neoniger CBS 115656]|uniref:Uncharacterized protein n=1 Tax=Aspergillus neoniger (strain CBS 115656) TaxID=1448310 RepID=A0A318YV99_ASPNB|nr:hypothetical protein BO87DRAFT_378813 [Aspergillus neoniger CBS 115656]PYH31798.1 hypothetical protein BO87DRAFT_378813 [Aspergillus neoniger CBS 115656]